MWNIFFLCRLAISMSSLEKGLFVSFALSSLDSLFFGVEFDKFFIDFGY